MIKRCCSIINNPHEVDDHNVVTWSGRGSSMGLKPFQEVLFKTLRCSVQCQHRCSVHRCGVSRQQVRLLSNRQCLQSTTPYCTQVHSTIIISTQYDRLRPHPLQRTHRRYRSTSRGRYRPSINTARHMSCTPAILLICTASKTPVIPRSQRTTSSLGQARSYQKAPL